MAQQQLSVMINDIHLNEIEKRKSNVSWCVDYSLNSLCGLYEFYRPQILNKFDELELATIINVVVPNINVFRSTPAKVLPAMVVGLSEGKINNNTIKKIQKLELIEFMTLIDYCLCMIKEQGEPSE